MPGTDGGHRTVRVSDRKRTIGSGEWPLLAEDGDDQHEDFQDKDNLRENDQQEDDQHVKCV